MLNRLFCFVILYLIGTVATGAAVAGDAPDATTLTRQREQFRLAWETARHGPDMLWRKLAQGLEQYSLYPYLEAASLQRRMKQLKRADVEHFLAAWPDTLAGEDVREEFLQELARRKDWIGFLALLPAQAPSRELQCDALQARLALHRPLDFQRDLEPLWLSAAALPDACDAAVHWAREQGRLSAALIWKRIDLTAEAGNASVVAGLAAMLDGAEQDAARRIAAALSDPAKALEDAAHWNDTPRTRDAVALALRRLARRDSDRAETSWAQLESRFRFSAAQRAPILRALAIYRATSYDEDAQARLDALPAEFADDATREWRVRVALAAGNFAGTLKALDALTPEQQADPRWRYLRARVLVKLDREADAMPLLGGLAHEANFHGFLAADWLQQPYSICPDQLADDPAADAAVRNNAAMTRAFEFFALDMPAPARREWAFALAQLSPAERSAAAVHAHDLGWYDRAVYAFGHGDEMRLYTLRFPLARRDQVVRQARAAEIEPAWAYAIIRAESAWTTDAHSSADAWGLMQLLPSTAAQLAKSLKLRYGGTRDLLDPDTNITLGTRYLGRMAAHFDGSPWLASAAYNAGVDPVTRWMDARAALEPDFFIETIPYRETREYVSRVLAFSVIYDWRLHGEVVPLSSRLPRIGSAYAPPGDDAPRKQVVCAM
jgi:soluble lytic murein transglycosylase